ncbi:NAD kinase [Basilea psittacipulmonis]|uniref:NAD kinase n=1 Tax=Basilea psittacipulmonis DSM 24701 TaxID=1072685 RepID=A0A077DGE2_9BURK|nr:NAD kinase [Basilea psittacipulmonis]AIL32203.1 inorganic polyphosphate kinase [Basilea psittacipulmonis DSM 24701]
MNFPTIAIVGRYQDSGITQAINHLAKYLLNKGRNVLIEQETALHTGITYFPSISYDEIGKKAQLVIVMGGDGTMLGAGRKLAKYGIPLLGINHGNLGFITGVPNKDTLVALEAILSGSYEIEGRTMLEARIIRNGKELIRDYALNDVVLNRSGRSGMIEISVLLNGELMYTQKADGVIVATPTGSTAYSVSANGPILHPRASAFLVVPVAPQTLSSRPIAVSDKDELELRLSEISRRPNAASVQFDMQTWSDLQVGDHISIRKAPYKAFFIHPHKFEYFSVLRKKLQWNTLYEQFN